MSGCGKDAPAYPSDCDLTAALREQAGRKGGTVERSAAWRAVLPRAGLVEVLLLDVDGVLTDGTLLYVGEEEGKRFHTRDGFGLRLLREAGIRTGIVTARQSTAVTRRAAELEMEFVYTRRGDKGEALMEIASLAGVEPRRIAYMGDDWLDLPALERAGFSLAPADAAPEVALRVDYLCQHPGGHGAVREACDLLLAARGLLDTMLNSYLRR
jgi:3-deoxy-D-manno-octulosonate 8-phosphate phosphatase (KDO 8-P phosphatase)